MSWVYWLQIIGPITAILADGTIVCEQRRFAEWRPDMTTADGW